MKIFLILIFTSGFTLAQIQFTQDTIAYNNRFNNRQFAQYNSQGLLRLTYTGGLGTVSSFNELFFVEEDALGNFSTVNITNNSVDDNYSTLSIDQNDNIHICYESRDPSIFQVMYINNVSGSFSSPIAITQGGLNKGTPYGKIGPDSVMHFVYYTFTSGTDNFYYRGYDLKTSTLTPEVFLSNGEASGDFEASLDVDSNGKVHIAGRSGAGLWSGPLKYFNNTSGTFQEYTTNVTTDINYPRIRIDSDNKVHIVYSSNSRLYYINNVSGTFSAPAAITPVGQMPSGIQAMEVDDQNRLFITYQSSQSASGKGFYLLFAENYVFNDTILIADLSPGHILRNSSQVITNSNGDIAMLYAESGIRNDTVICDIFMKRGSIYEIIPVELSSFTATVKEDNIQLYWTTATETNNLGFEIEKINPSKSENIYDWEKIGFVPGCGTSTKPKSYSFVDKDITPGKHKYRLKQIDLDGSYEYSDIIEAEVMQKLNYTLMQNYPNPFNPTTKIKFTIPSVETTRRVVFTTLKVYDILGNEIVTLVNEEKPAGNYNVIFDASKLSSGVYFYTLKTGEFSKTNKMILTK